MDAKRILGRNSGVQKYDLLTALAISGMHGTQGHQTSMLRLIALVTARYNWRADEFCVGQRDMARIWGVNERTVKREIKRLCADGILICKRQGVRGRVGSYRLNIPEIYRRTSQLWSSVGPDFAERMNTNQPDRPATVVKVDFRSAPEPQGQGGWRDVMSNLRQRTPSSYVNWYAHVTKEGFENGVLTLKASSNFVAHYIQTHLAAELIAEVERHMGPVQRLVVISQS